MSLHRDSSKHGPLQDDVLRADIEAELTGEDLPAGTRAGGTPPGMDADDVTGRSELARWLQPGAFPADRDRLLDSAADTRAPDGVVRFLEALPEGGSYRNVQDVWRALGGGTEDVNHRT